MTDNLMGNNNSGNNDIEQEALKASNEVNSIVNQEINKKKEKEDVVIDVEAIHVMPKKFLPQSPKKKLSNKQKFILAIIGFILFLILVVGVMLWLADRSINQEPENSANNNEQSNNNSPEQLSHDAKIVNDLEQINDALKRYFSEFGVYPSSLADLASYFDNGVPRDPSGLNYEYELKNLGTDFQILAEFDGSDDNNRIGIYQLTKYGVDYYDPESQNNIGIITPPPPPPPSNSTATSTPITPPPPPPTEDNLDSDKDLLTSSEETLYNTNANSDDSDNDGFRDGVEIANLYNPLATSGNLIDTGVISIYNSPSFNYSVFYPTSWVAQSLNDSANEIVFLNNIETGEFISVQVLTEEFPLGLEEWQAKAEIAGSLVGYSLGKSQKLPAAITTDGRNVLFIKDGTGNTAYLISYHLAAGLDSNFQKTFEMMLNSFEIAND